MKTALIVMYLLAIALANVITASLDPLVWGKMIIPAGSFLIGATFILRDLVQNTVGRKKTYLAIGSAMVLSAITSAALGDTLWITAASAVSFLFSETADTEVYTRLRLPMPLKVLYSGIVGGILDSGIFVVVGLSPLGANFVPWSAVGYAIAGQIAVKIIMQLAGAMIVQFMSHRRNNAAQA